MSGSDVDIGCDSAAGGGGGGLKKHFHHENIEKRNEKWKITVADHSVVVAGLAKQQAVERVKDLDLCVSLPHFLYFHNYIYMVWPRYKKHNWMEKEKRIEKVHNTIENNKTTYKKHKKRAAFHYHNKT